MKKAILIIIPVLWLAACRQTATSNTTTVAQKSTIVLHIDVDTAGNLTDTTVKRQLTDLALRIGNNADKVIINSYTEQRATQEESVALAAKQANAVKAFMLPIHERVYYNVGIDAKGFAKPIDAANPASLANRRIEIVYLN